MVRGEAQTCVTVTMMMRRADQTLALHTTGEELTSNYTLPRHRAGGSSGAPAITHVCLKREGRQIAQSLCGGGAKASSREAVGTELLGAARREPA